MLAESLQGNFSSYFAILEEFLNFPDQLLCFNARLLKRKTSDQNLCNYCVIKPIWKNLKNNVRANH